MKSAKKKSNKLRKRILVALMLLIGVTIIATGVIAYGPVKTLASLEKVDDFPLYVMTYHGTYLFDLFIEEGIEWGPYKKIDETVNPEACTSFAALNEAGDAVFGRNLDWHHRSSLLLYTKPPNGYASISMVDLYYLGYEGMQEIPWSKRLPLLATPYATIDGMNECGVAISQNAVPQRNTPTDPNKPTLLQSQILRLVLDHAKDVDEALELIRNYNVKFLLPNHFHIADASGNSAIVEYIDDGMAILRNKNPWQVSTNFLLSESQQPDCWRYQKANAVLAETQGVASQNEAMDLLHATSQDHTVWSVVYNLSSGEIRLAMGKEYNKVFSFKLKMKNRN
ncbi:MAG: linear amide C-N hydrolase [Sedimentisphaerales bacterium]|nr:linear amide C-N hydrolase [Sedimentisphaerales bacterium]